MPRRSRAPGYLAALAATLACSLAGWLLHEPFDLVNVAMVYLLGVVLVAVRYPGGPAVLASILCVAAFDLLFVPPRGTFAVEDVQYLLTFAIMLGVALVISRLVSDLRRRVREQAALEIEAETERIRSTLLASISHDLRTPLAVIEGASSTLARSGETLPAQERIELACSIFVRSREMSERVQKVLQMTRLEAGAVHPERDWMSIGEVIGSTVERLQPVLAAHRVIVEIPDTLPLVRADAALIEQAIVNLLENAARHTPAGTVVRVRARHAADELVVSVEDYGGGPQEADLERIFHKFHHGTLEGNAGGVGLGLAICRAIVRLHGGRAWAERLPVGGMAFRFALPVEPSPGVPQESPSGLDERRPAHDPAR
jgi:two-component system sensor histidine kinase KdpD